MEDTEKKAASPAPAWRLRDGALAVELRDRLAHDRRTAHLQLDVYVDGGVAHVEGEAATEEERGFVRAFLRGQGSLHAAWDLLTVQGQRLDIADFGCGGQKQVPSALGVDRVPGPAVDVVTDLEATLPFEDNSFDHIFAVHVLEHIQDLLGLMRELHRVLRPTGVLHVLAPHWRHVNAVADPTHCRYLDVQTFKYFCLPGPGVLPWKPLIATASGDTVHADMQPLKDGTYAGPAALARWFD